MLLPDHVLLERRRDRLRIGDEPALRLLRAGRAVVLLQHLLTQVDALVADVDPGAGDQLANLVLTLPTEGATGVSAAIFSLGHRSSASDPTLVRAGDVPAECRSRGSRTRCRCRRQNRR